MSDYRHIIRQQIQAPPDDQWQEVVMLFYQMLHAYDDLLAHEQDTRQSVEPAATKRTNYNRTETGICLLGSKPRPPIRTETRETMRPPLWAA